MKRNNAHLRMGTLTFVKQTRDTVTDVTVHLNQLVAEQPVAAGPAAAIHLASVLEETSRSAPSQQPLTKGSSFRSRRLA